MLSVFPSLLNQLSVGEFSFLHPQSFHTNGGVQMFIPHFSYFKLKFSFHHHIDTWSVPPRAQNRPWCFTFRWKSESLITRAVFIHSTRTFHFHFHLRISIFQQFFTLMFYSQQQASTRPSSSSSNSKSFFFSFPTSSNCLRISLSLPIFLKAFQQRRRLIKGKFVCMFLWRLKWEGRRNVPMGKVLKKWSVLKVPRKITAGDDGFSKFLKFIFSSESFWKI